MKAIYIIPVISKVRCYKRIKELEKEGIDYEVISFRRSFDVEQKMPDYKNILSLGYVKNEDYLNRFILFIKSFFKIRSKFKDADIIYVFNLDLLLMACLVKMSVGNKLNIIYEIGDIRSILLKDKPLSRVLRTLEKYLLKNVDLLVVTSEAFLTEYYNNILGVKKIKYQVIENKPIIKVNDIQKLQDKKTDKDYITIGYFGSLRCSRSWECLKSIVKKSNGKIKLYVRGIIFEPENLKEDAEIIEGILYEGSYKSPDELNYIYNQVDIVWACYPYQGTQKGNWSWARTNRFYESCYFKKPMIAQKNTEDCKVIKRFNIGDCVDLDNYEDEIERIINSIEQKLATWLININNIPTKLYTVQNEHKVLSQTIKSM